MLSNAAQPAGKAGLRILPYLRVGLVACLLFVIVGLVVHLFSNTRGVIRVQELQRQLALVQQQIASSEQINLQLRREVESLRSDLVMVEYLARYDLRMMRENEILFEWQENERNAGQ